MRIAASTLGVIVTVGFALAAAVMNWRYGISLGRSMEDRLLFGAIAIGVDVTKMLMPAFLWWAIRNRRWLPAGLSAVVLIGSVTYSIIGIAGFVDANRITTAGAVRARRDTATELQRNLERKQTQLSGLGDFEPPTVVERKLFGMKQNARWASSAGCTSATAEASRVFCMGYAALQAEFEKGNSASKLETEIADLRAKLNELAGVANIEEGDPRASFVSRLMGWELSSVQTGLSVLFVTVIEMTATFGIFIALNHGELGRMLPTQMRQAQSASQGIDIGRILRAGPGTALGKRGASNASRQGGDVGAFVVACMRPQPGGEVAVSALYTRYSAWCQQHRHRPVSRSSFVELFEQLCAEAGFPTAMVGGEVIAKNLLLAA